MSGPKTEFNNQWGQASADGAAVAPADVTPVAAGDGIAPLVDLYGRPYVNVVGGGGGAATEVALIVPQGAINGQNTPVNLGSAIESAGVSFVINNGCRVYTVFITNESTAGRFGQLFNNPTGLPIVGQVPVISVPLKGGGANEFVTLQFGALGTLFQSGFQVVVSSNFADYDDTGVVAANHSIFASYQQQLIP